MRERFNQHSDAWVNFSYGSFALSCIMVIGGIFLLPLDIWPRAFLFMGVLMIIQTAINVTKTLRDNQEGSKLISKIEDAKTEKLLLDIGSRKGELEPASH